MQTKWTFVIQLLVAVLVDVGLTDRYGPSGCYERWLQGYRLASGRPQRIIHGASLRMCEEECAATRGCAAFAYGTSGTANGTCELATRSRDPRSVSKNQTLSFDDVNKSTQYDVYIENVGEPCFKTSPLFSSTSSSHNGIPIDCFFRLMSGKRLAKNQALKSISVNSLQECQEACIAERSFACRSISYRYMPTVSTYAVSNCELSPYFLVHYDDSPRSKYDFVDDYDYDYFQREPHCKTTSSIGATFGVCSVVVRRGSKLSDSLVKSAHQVTTSSQCEHLCTTSPFRCRAFAFRHTERGRERDPFHRSPSYLPPGSSGSDSCLLYEADVTRLPTYNVEVHQDYDLFEMGRLMGAECVLYDQFLNRRPSGLGYPPVTSTAQPYYPPGRPYDNYGRYPYGRPEDRPQDRIDGYPYPPRPSGSGSSSSSSSSSGEIGHFNRENYYQRPRPDQSSRPSFPPPPASPNYSPAYERPGYDRDRPAYDRDRDRDRPYQSNYDRDRPSKPSYDGDRDRPQPSYNRPPPPSYDRDRPPPSSQPAYERPAQPAYNRPSQQPSFGSYPPSGHGYEPDRERPVYGPEPEPPRPSYGQSSQGGYSKPEPQGPSFRPSQGSYGKPIDQPKPNYGQSSNTGFSKPDSTSSYGSQPQPTYSPQQPPPQAPTYSPESVKAPDTESPGSSPTDLPFYDKKMEACLVKLKHDASLIPEASRATFPVKTLEECRVECLRSFDVLRFACRVMSFRLTSQTGGSCQLSDKDHRELQERDFIPTRDRYENGVIYYYDDREAGCRRDDRLGEGRYGSGGAVGGYGQYYDRDRYRPNDYYDNNRRYDNNRYPPQSQYPDSRYPDNRYPDNRYPDNRYPDNRYPDNRYPNYGQNYNGVRPTSGYGSAYQYPPSGKGYDDRRYDSYNRYGYYSTPGYDRYSDRKDGYYGGSGGDGANEYTRGGGMSTVNGERCLKTCRQNRDAGFYYCQVDDQGAWDFCCRPDHFCGFSREISVPWCYVGSGPSQNIWRTCNHRVLSQDNRLYNPNVAYLHEGAPPSIMTLTTNEVANLTKDNALLLFKGQPPVFDPLSNGDLSSSEDGKKTSLPGITETLASESNTITTTFDLNKEFTTSLANVSDILVESQVIEEALAADKENVTRLNRRTPRTRVDPSFTVVEVKSSSSKKSNG